MGVGFAVEKSLINEVMWTRTLISDRLLSIAFNLGSKWDAVTFVVADARTDTSNSRDKIVHMNDVCGGPVSFVHCKPCYSSLTTDS